MAVGMVNLLGVHMFLRVGVFMGVHMFLRVGVFINHPLNHVSVIPWLFICHEYIHLGGANPLFENSPDSDIHSLQV
jgi:hypothetical protein